MVWGRGITCRVVVDYASQTARVLRELREIQTREWLAPPPGRRVDRDMEIVPYLRVYHRELQWSGRVRSVSQAAEPGAPQRVHVIWDHHPPSTVDASQLVPYPAPRQLADSLERP